MAVKKGDRVKVDYTGTLEDGTVFDSSIHGEHSHPIEVVIGSEQVIPGFENALIGMEIGEEKDITIPPEEGYGLPDPGLIESIPKESLPGLQDIQAGQSFMIGLPEGGEMPIRVKEVTISHVVFDLNHPLAGKTINFKIKVVSILSKD